MNTRKTRHSIVANVYNSNEQVRLSVSDYLWSATARAEMSTGIKLCGYHRGRKWGVVHMLDIWTKRDGTINGDVYTAYLLTDENDRAAFDSICEGFNPYYYKF